MLITLLHRGWKVPVENMTAKHTEFVEDLRPATGMSAQKGIDLDMGSRSMEIRHLLVSSSSIQDRDRLTLPKASLLSLLIPCSIPETLKGQP